MHLVATVPRVAAEDEEVGVHPGFQSANTIIDFEGCSVGDPSSDLIAAWWMFDADSRPIFRDTIQPDEAQWIRGMGWALYMTVAAIPYHTDTNPEFAAMARSALDQIRAS